MKTSAGWLTGLLWTAPWWLGFLIFLAAPLALSLYISFCDYPLLQAPVFIGAANYSALTRDPLFGRVLFNTLVYAACAIPLGTVAAVLLAILLNQPVRGQGFFRACIFVPTIVPVVVAGIVWLWLLNPQTGQINQALQALLLPKPDWLGHPVWALAALVLVSLWFIGSPVVIYLAGLQEIPVELYEAATIDGAGTARRFWHITLPGLSPVILFNVIIAIIATWQIFALPFILWRGQRGPQDSTYFYTMYLFDNAFRYLQMGYASAMAWVQLLIILTLTALVFFVSRRFVHYRGA
ncbi:MAG: sugar ABC transporter permease [Phycisphaerales bacterium]|nr:sugar ABC transporter permease [Phycisphaerales bacterium]